MSSRQTPRKVLLELLATRATEGLLPTDDARLTTLLHAEPDLDEHYFDLAATAVDLAVDSDLEALPPALELRLVEDGRAHFAPGEDETADDEPSPEASSTDGYLDDEAADDGYAEARRDEAPVVGAHTDSTSATDAATDNVVSFRREETRTERAESRRGFDWTRWAGWVAAAAVAGAAVGLRYFAPAPAPVKPAPIVAPPAPQPPTLAEKRGRLLADANDLRRVAWAPTDHPLGGNVTGEVVWSDRAQEGYMTFHGLAWNDPTQRQYQLWIFDVTRSDERPVDGGVFDIPASPGEVIVPIDAKLRVDEATLFAITLERPGGVVVSARKDLLLLAPVA